MESEIVEVTLPDGEVILVQAKPIDGGGATKTGFGRLDLKGVSKTLESVAEAIGDAVRTAAPTKVSVEMGIDLAIKSGVLVGLLVDGESKASLTVNLEWDRTDSRTQIQPGS